MKKLLPLLFLLCFLFPSQTHAVSEMDLATSTSLASDDYLRIIWYNGGDWESRKITMADAFISWNVGNTKYVCTNGSGLPIACTTFPILPETVTAGGTCSTSYAPDLNVAEMYTLTLNGACELSNPSNLAAGKSFTVKLTQSSTTAPTFGTAYKWAAGTQPTWSTSATKYDVLSCASFDGSTLQCAGIIDVR